jgi:hypothetical protein
MLKKFSLAAVGALVAVVALWSAVAAADNVPSVPIQFGPSFCGLNDGSPPIGSVKYGLKGTKLALTINLNLGGGGRGKPPQSNPVSFYLMDANTCGLVQNLGSVAINKNLSGAGDFAVNVPCTGARYYVETYTLSVDGFASDSLVFTVPATC